MKVQLIRHASLLIEMKGVSILVDPMLSDAETLDPTPNTMPPMKNPLVALPSNVTLETLKKVDAVFITHTHRDHFDDAAIKFLPTDIAIFCQPEDLDKITGHGFSNVTAIADNLVWQGMHVKRTKGRHGTGEIGEKMGPVSGFIYEAENEPSLYITGDTVWCQEVQEACKSQPDVVIAFAGGAEFFTGGPITMSADDILRLSQELTNSTIVAVHMNAWNHCHLTRERLRGFLTELSLTQRVLIPENGDIMTFPVE